MKLINANLKSKEEMADFLCQGGTLYGSGPNEYQYEGERIFDGGSPYRCIYKEESVPINSLWSGFAELKKEASWEECLELGDKILCWVKNAGSTDWRLAVITGKSESVITATGYIPGVALYIENTPGGDSNIWEYAKPIKSSETWEGE